MATKTVVFLHGHAIEMILTLVFLWLISFVQYEPADLNQMALEEACFNQGRITLQDFNAMKGQNK